MKNTRLKTIFCLVLAIATVLLCASCAKNGQGRTDEDGGADISPEGIIGRWSVGEGERVKSEMPEEWEFTADGRFVHLQTDGQGKGVVVGALAVKPAIRAIVT